MTTLSDSTGFNISTDAALRSQGTEFNYYLTSVGLIQTADTGQIDWSTITLPGLNAIIGYEIWKFSDSSIYFKLEWEENTSVASGSPGFYLTVGTGSDGAGSITGTTFARTNIVNNVNSVNGSPRPTLICHTADFFGIVYKLGGSNTWPAILGFAIEKLVDASGTPIGASSIGVTYFGATASAVANKYSYTGSTAYGPSTAFCVVPMNATESEISLLHREVYPHLMRTPRSIPSKFLGTVLSQELPFGNTCTATLVGATPHTYIGLSNGLGTGNSASAATTWATMMLWE